MPLTMTDVSLPEGPGMIPLFRCKYCHQPIRQLRDGAVYWFTLDRPNGDPLVTAVEFAHRGNCFLQASEVMSSSGGVLMDMQLDHFISALPKH